MASPAAVKKAATFANILVLGMGASGSVGDRPERSVATISTVVFVQLVWNAER